MIQRAVRFWAIASCLLWGCEETRLLTADVSQSAPDSRLVDTTSARALDSAARYADSGTSQGLVDTARVADSGDTATGTGSLVYAHIAPPSTPTPPALAPESWVEHARVDLMPFWMQPQAMGEPMGNFPTFRQMDGGLTNTTERRPRMIGRQVFTYCAAFLMTGDTAYLAPAQAGVDWLLYSAWDSTYGGWHARLDAGGAPLGADPKTAQDAAYAALGLSAWFFVTRDPMAEARILATRDLLLDGVFWDAENARVKDGVTFDHYEDVDVANDGGAELVAQLDPINAFLLLSHRVLTDDARRGQFTADLQRLAGVLVRDFYSEGTFWGVQNQQGSYGGRHTDFGHNLKAFWMLLQVDKTLTENPYRQLIEEQLNQQLAFAYDAQRGRWGKRMLSSQSVEYGADWWMWAEIDQLVATLGLLGWDYEEWLQATAAHWYDFVDTTRPARELIPTLDAEGEWVYPWPVSDTAKANAWKSGYHGLEHALILYLYGHWRSDTVATLYFAPLLGSEDGDVTPYLWHGVEVERETVGSVTLAGQTHTVLQVGFRDLY